MSIAEDTASAVAAPPIVSSVVSFPAVKTTLGVLVAISAAHMLNDMMQSLAPALYPVFQRDYGLSFFQLGMITFAFQVTASVLQPGIGLFTDRKPMPFSLPVAMAFTLSGLTLSLIHI